MKKAKVLYGQKVCKKCYYGFANRRNFAFAVDIFLWNIVFFAFEAIIGGFGTADLTSFYWMLSIAIFGLKDGFAGNSPGKALFGVQTMIEATGRPAGFGASCKRNLPLCIPFMFLVVSSQLLKGHRTGDGWANTKVIWKKYRTHPVFSVGIRKPSPIILTKQMEQRTLKSEGVSASKPDEELPKAHERLNSMKKQLVILWIGICLAVLAILFPPIRHGSFFEGYGFLFTSQYRIEPYRLTLTILIIVLFTAGALYTNHVMSEEARKKLKRIIKFLACSIAAAVVIALCGVALRLLEIHWRKSATEPIAEKPVPRWEDFVPDTHQPAPQPQRTRKAPVVYKTIHEAARQGDIAAVKICLQKGVAVDSRADSAMETPLMLAAAKGYLDVVKYLVENGADVNAADKDGRTPLWWAASKGYLEVIKYLTEKGADVSVSSAGSWTPLRVAEKEGYLDVVEFLKQHGAKE